MLKLSPILKQRTTKNYLKMKAIIKTTYGGPEVLKLEEVEKPPLKEGHLLIKVIANSANPADWHVLRGKPVLARFSSGLFKPSNKILGADFAGIVEQTGNEVTNFKVGDRVFGEDLEAGVFAEFASIKASNCARMPAGTDFPEMAGVPVAGLTALQALITHGNLQNSESVLINGASGGVGHFAVQIAKAYGAKVTGVCSEKNKEFVKALGADQVIAYDRENIHQHNGKFNLVLDTHGNLTHQDFTRMGQRGVLIGFTTMSHMIRLFFKRSLNSFPLTIFTAKANTKDLETLASLIQSGKVIVHIDRVYPYHQIPEAIAYIEAMHTRGKVAMVWESMKVAVNDPAKEKVELERDGL